ncbi:unnamed protein product [Auanema sp. JU1783]|nr:unnamed protein product [Auanema sp. JU1783]
MPTEEINHGVVRLGNPYYLHVEKKGKFAKAVTTNVTSVPEGVRPVDLCGQPQVPDVLLTDIDQFIVWCRDEGLLPLGSNRGPSVRLMAKKLDKLIFGGQRVEKVEV